MNFLEQLAYEWYSYSGYFVRSNIKYDKRPNGGYGGEMDVIAFDYKSNKLIHVEASMDGDSNAIRIERFTRKFAIPIEKYNFTLNTEVSTVEQIAIVGTAKATIDFGNGIRHLTIPSFMNYITREVKDIDPMLAPISEGYPILRGIQFSNYYLFRE